MDTTLRRPRTVWIAQILLVFFALLLLFVLLTNLLGRLTNEDEVPVVGLVIAVIVFIGPVLLLLISFWGLAMRKNYGRWLSIAFLILLWGIMLMGQLFRPSGPHQYYVYKNTTERVAAAIATVCFNALFLILICRLAFAKKVKEFFREQQPDPPPLLPPGAFDQ